MSSNSVNFADTKKRILQGDVWVLMQWLAGFGTSADADRSLQIEFGHPPMITTTVTHLEYEVFPQGNTAYDMLREAGLLIESDGDNGSQLLFAVCRDGTKLALVSRASWELYTNAVKAKDVQLREMGSVAFLQALLAPKRIRCAAAGCASRTASEYGSTLAPVGTRFQLALLNTNVRTSLRRYLRKQSDSTAGESASICTRGFVLLEDFL